MAIDGDHVAVGLSVDGTECEGDGLSEPAFTVGFRLVEGFGDHLDLGRGAEREDHCYEWCVR